MAQFHTDKNELRCILERKPARLVTVAMTNKTAWIVWAALAQNQPYRSASAI